MESRRRALVAICGIVAILLPVRAAAQKDIFVDAYVAFHSALAGTYGDEGRSVSAELDRMSAALDGWERSSRAAESDLKSHPNTTPAELALLYADTQQLDLAINAITSAIAAEPPRAATYIYLGRLHAAAGRSAEALAAFKRARAIDPTDPRAAYLLATRIAENGVDETPQSLAATLLAAAERSGGPRVSFPDFALVDDLAAPTPVFAPPAYAEGFASMARRDFRSALTAFRTASARDPLVSDPAAHSPEVQMGVAALRARQGAAAVQHAEAAVALFPMSSEAHRVLGIVYRAVGRTNDSVKQFEAAVRLAPNDERSRLGLGVTLADANRLQDASQTLRETIAELPASGSARWVLADVYEKLERGADAIPVLESAAELAAVAGRVHLYWRIAQLAHGYHRDHERVIRVLTRRASLVPNNPHGHKDLGLAYVRAGRDDEALIELLMASLLGLDDGETLTAIGQIHLTAGRLDRADTAL
jgi:tetratricopeptide (TPR) repeat protein